MKVRTPTGWQTLTAPTEQYAKFERVDRTTMTGAELDAVLATVNRGDFEGAPSHETPRAPRKPREYPRRTHCQNGHEMSGENVLHMKSGLRMVRACRTCRRAREVKAYEKRKRGRRTRLSAEQVREILATPREWGSQAALAKKFGVDPSTISYVASGATWKHERLEEAA